MCSCSLPLCSFEIDTFNWVDLQRRPATKLTSPQQQRSEWSRWTDTVSRRMETGTATAMATATAMEYWAMETCCHRTRWRAGGPLAWSMGRTNTWRRRPLDLSWTRMGRAWRRSSSGPWSRPPPVKVSGEYYVEQFLHLLLFILLGYLWFNNELIDQWYRQQKKKIVVYTLCVWMDGGETMEVRCEVQNWRWILLYIYIREEHRGEWGETVKLYYCQTVKLLGSNLVSLNCFGSQIDIYTNKTKSKEV